MANCSSHHAANVVATRSAMARACCSGRSIGIGPPSRAGPTNGFYQPDLEEVLESVALDLPSVAVRRGWSADGITQDDSGVTLTLTHTADRSQPEQLRGSWLIAADGADYGASQVKV